MDRSQHNLLSSQQTLNTPIVPNLTREHEPRSVMVAVYLLPLLLVAFTGRFVEAHAQQLHFSTRVDCNELFDDHHDTIPRWRTTAGDLDAQDRRIVAQLIMDQFQMIKIDEESIVSQYRSAVTMATHAEHDAQEQVERSPYHTAQEQLIENGYKISEHQSGKEEDLDLASFFLGNARFISLPGTNGHLRSRGISTSKQDGTIDFFMDKNHLQQFVHKKRKWDDIPIFAVVDCKIDEAAHSYQHHERYRKQERIRESYYVFYTMASVLVVFLISRLKVKIDFKLDIGKVSDPREGKIDDPDPTVTVDAILINSDEPQAVIVY